MDRDGKELASPGVWALFDRTYLLSAAPLTLTSQMSAPTGRDSRDLTAVLRRPDGSTLTVSGAGNGPVDAFVDALKRAFGLEFSFLDYHEHAVGRGASATAACYVELQDAHGEIIHGASIVTASLKAVLSGVLRLLAREGRSP
jgi:2-isopropylmalate synthase